MLVQLAGLVLYGDVRQGVQRWNCLHVCPNCNIRLQLVIEGFNGFSLQIFERVCTIQRDMEKLIEPMLGLCSLLLTNGAGRKLQFIREHTALNKNKFLPATCILQEAGHKAQTSALWTSS